MTQARAWLPGDTAPPAAVHAALAARVDGWARRWFAATPPSLGTLIRGTGAAMAWRACDGMMLGIAVTGMTGVGARMLDVTATARRDADRALLEEIAEPCLADLRGRMAEGDWHPAIAPPDWIAPIDTGASSSVPVLALGLSAARFAALVRRSLPPVVAAPLGSAGAALAALPVTVGAAAGRVALSLADLAAIGVGDVVLLDARVAATLPIALDGHPLAHGRVAVVAAAPAPFLKIVEPPCRTSIA